MSLELKLSEQERLTVAFKLQNHVSLTKETMLGILYEDLDCSYDGGMKLFPLRDSIDDQVKKEVSSKKDFDNTDPDLQKGLIKFLLQQWHKVVYGDYFLTKPLKEVFLPFPKAIIHEGKINFDPEKTQKIKVNGLCEYNDITLNFSEEFLKDIGKTPFCYTLDVFEEYVEQEVDEHPDYKKQLDPLGVINDNRLVKKFFDSTINHLTSNDLNAPTGNFSLVEAETTRRYIDVLVQEGLITKNNDLLGVNQELCKEIIGAKEKDDAKTFVQTIKELKIKKEVLEDARYVYVTDPGVKTAAKVLNPYRIGREFLGDLIKISAKFAKNDRHKEVVDLSKQIIIARELPKEGDFRSALSKSTKTRFSQIMDAIKNHEQIGFSGGVVITKSWNNIYGNISYTIGGDMSDVKTSNPVVELTELNTKQFNVFDVDPNENLTNIITEEAKKGNNPMYLAYRDMIASEMIKILETAGKEHSEVYNAYKIFWERYVPYEFDLTFIYALSDGKVSTNKLQNKYTFAVRKSEKPLDNAVTDSLSCLEDADIKIFTEDEGTVNLIEYGENLDGKNNQPIGYVRFFLMKTNKGDSALCLDTLEIGDKKFQEYNDHVRAMGLAAIQLMLDSNVKYLLGEDARVAHGLRQGFGDKYMKTKLQKLGTRMILANDQIRGPYSYMYDALGNWKGETSVLALNWRLA